MPRFDNNGYDREQGSRNDMRDRSVPTDENYYAQRDINDFGIEKYSSAPVIDRQTRGYSEEETIIMPPMRNERQSSSDFVPEVMRDYDRPPRRSGDNRRRDRKHNGKKKKSKLSRSKRRAIRIAAVIMVIILLLNTALNAMLDKITYDEHIKNQYISSSELKSDPMVKNILLLGVDARKNQESASSRSDSMMLISIDLKHNAIKTVSFLRDTWVYIPCHDGEQRLNAACRYGGYSGVSDTIEYNFGVKIDGYVVVDFGMFQTLVDSLGGVEIDVTEAEAKEINNHKRRYGNVTIDFGKQMLTGKQALAYCRIRKIDTDFMRAKRQRTVMKSIIGGVKHSNPLTMLKMANGATPYLETNLSKSQIKRYMLRASLCLSNDMVEDRVPFDGTWEYAKIRGNSVITINKEKNKERLISFIYEKSVDEIKAEQESKENK